MTSDWQPVGRGVRRLRRFDTMPECDRQTERTDDKYRADVMHGIALLMTAIEHT